VPAALFILSIKVFDRADIYVPSGFTPDEDGLNDFLFPICIGIKQFNYFRIYDRSGNIIFQSRNQFGRWDGTYTGAKMNTQNQVWMAEVITFDGRLIRRNGNVVIIR
jgi:gliding motility-associated-like protein